MKSPTDQLFINHVAEQLGTVPGVQSVALCGSRAPVRIVLIATSISQFITVGILSLIIFIHLAGLVLFLK